MPVYALGALNTTALTAPDVYIQKVPPQTRYINGVPTDILGLVGVGSWGPVNAATLAAPDTFGPVTVRARDLATAIAVSAQNGAQNIRAVRVTDGTDAAASAALLDIATPIAATGLTLTAFHTGTVGNSLGATVTAGTKAGTYKLTIQRPNYTAEVFDNIAGTGAALWTAMADAVNNGRSGIRGPSQLCVATAGASTATPDTTKTYTLAGGTDGAGAVTDTTLLGADGTAPATRTGLYALRGSGAQVLNPVDLDSPTNWPTIVAFAEAEGMYAVVADVAGADYSTTSTDLDTAGADDPALKVMVGDWVYWLDTVNGVQRLLSPATFVAAEIAATAPHLSSLNKPLAGAIGTQRTSQNQPYSLAEIGAAATGRLDVITNPCPGGHYYGCRTGRNASSDPTRNGDNYTRMTNYIALTLAASYGWVIGQPQTTDLRRQAKSSMEAFLATLEGQGMIGDPNGGPAFSVVLDSTNNPASRVALGYMQADVQVKYLGIVWFFLVNLEGGQSVTVRAPAAA
jgi:phage tail sheath protein FI